MKIKFKDAVQIISGGTPKTSVPEYWNGDIGWLSVVDFVNNNKYVETTEKKITQEGLENSSTKLLATNDIIISARGTVGAMAMLKRPLAFNQSCFGLRANSKLLNQDYLFYYLKNYMKILKVKKQGSVFDTINLSTFDFINLDLPTIDNQAKVASILSDIDNKIELNNKIISELESMAKTIYDYWFLQFEFQNEDGKPYKSSGGKMVWNEELKREIPKGWEVFMVKDFCDIFTGKKDVNQALDTGKYKFFSCAPGYKYSNDKLYTGKAILISGNGSYTGRTIFVNDSFDLYQRTYACVMKPNYDNMLEYIFYTMKTFFVKRVSGGTHGSAIPYIVYNDIANEHFYYNKEVVDTFMKTIEPIQEHIIELSKENQELASLRDFLLPMLMNGQVTFKEKL